MDENTKAELLSRMDAININIDEPMTYEQIQYFMKGYECCRNNMYDVIDDTYRHVTKEKFIREVMKGQ